MKNWELVEVLEALDRHRPVKIQIRNAYGHMVMASIEDAVEEEDDEPIVRLEPDWKGSTP